MTYIYQGYYIDEKKKERGGVGREGRGGVTVYQIRAVKGDNASETSNTCRVCRG